MSHEPPQEPKRVQGKYLVIVVLLLAVLISALATWAISTLRPLPPEALPPATTGTR